MQQTLGSRSDTCDERGQATVAMAGVLVVIGLAALAISMVAEAMVDRARARTAADAVALAAAVDSSAATELARRYASQGIVVDRLGAHTIARSGLSRADAWAGLSPATEQPAPVLVAIVARAEQLTGAPFEDLRWHRTVIEIAAPDAPRLRTVSAGLGICELSEAPSGPDWIAFARC